MVFYELEEIDHIFIVTNEDYIDKCREIVESGGVKKVEAIVCGGSERQESVYNALQEVNRKRPGVEYVLIHDGARPYVNEETVLGVIKAAAENGAAAACVAMKDSVRKTFGEAYDKALKEGYRGTDDASLVERAGYEVKVVDGDYQNIKITTREDLPVESRVGTGFDVHRFETGRNLILGGVKIPYENGLAGHSDADVLLHALMDALLGAAALGDIGVHFPDTDDRYKGISSLILLSKVRELLNENFYSIGNVDITVIAQKPKISPYTEEMKSKISSVLKIEKNRINIKGTTTEKLGFTGRGEGIAAEAVCSIYR